MGAIILASPFLIGLIWSFISPFLVRQLANLFENQLDQELVVAGYERTPQSGLRQAAPRRPARKTKDSPTGANAGAQSDQALAATVEADYSPAIPLPVRPANLRKYVDWLVDVPQLLPTILLSAAGVIVAVAADRHVLLTSVVCAVAAVMGIIATFLIMKMSPQEYSAVFRYGIFTIGSLIATAINVASAVIIIVGVSV
jgi:hypothetical protein